MTNSDQTGDEERLCQRLSHFYSVLKPYRDAKQHLDRFLSTDFNIFKWIESDENRLSDIIADLLDPSGSHGQNRRFLDAFLEIIKRPDLKAEQLPKVGREVLTTHNRKKPYRRIDIVVDCGNDSFGLGIENKPWTADQKQQLQDYSDHLKEKYKDKFCLIYLTWEGRRDPPEASIERRNLENLKGKGQLICISYNPDILKWIEECSRLCESDRFRWFLRDLMDHLNGGQTMSIQNEREVLLQYALKSEENLKATWEINYVFNGDLHGQIIVNFLNKLESFILDRLRQRSDWGISVSYKDLIASPLEAHKAFGFSKTRWEKQYGVALIPQSPDASNFRIGVFRKGAERPALEDNLRRTLNESCGRGQDTTFWVWYRRLEEPYIKWNTKEALIKLRNGEAVKTLGPYFVQIIEVVDEHVGKS